jgi:hypothetical protein
MKAKIINIEYPVRYDAMINCEAFRQGPRITYQSPAERMPPATQNPSRLRRNWISAPSQNRGSEMNESEYYAGEISDAELNAIADAGDCYLEESGFYLMPSNGEIRQMLYEGNTFLELDRMNAKPFKDDPDDFERWLRGGLEWKWT